MLIYRRIIKGIALVGLVTIIVVASGCTSKEGESTATEEEEIVFKAAGDCPSSCSINWKNREIEQVVCAKTEAEAKRTAQRQERDALEGAARDACGLNCSTRPGCAAPATCQENFGRAQRTALGNDWTCNNTGEDCGGGKTNWNCSRFYDFKVKLKCECRR